jgi:hypothetical protein
MFSSTTACLHTLWSLFQCPITNLTRFTSTWYFENVLVQNRSTNSHWLTTLRGRRFEEVFGKASKIESAVLQVCLPIAPTPCHPAVVNKTKAQDLPTLGMRKGDRLLSNSCVNVNAVYEIEWKHLELCRISNDAEPKRYKAMILNRQSFQQPASKNWK